MEISYDDDKVVAEKEKVKVEKEMCYVCSHIVEDNKSYLKIHFCGKYLYYTFENEDKRNASKEIFKICVFRISKEIDYMVLILLLATED